MHIDIEKPERGYCPLWQKKNKILPLRHASLPKAAGSLLSPKYQLWNFAAQSCPPSQGGEFV